MTSVNYLIKEISAVLGVIKTEPMQDLLLVDAINKAKEMHKQEIIDAYEQGSDDEIVAYIGTRNYKHGLEYYTYTYGSKGSDKNKQ